MDTIHQPAVSSTDPLLPPEVTPYFDRVAAFRAVFDAEAARRGLPYEAWPA
jgi:hypothetical protein